MLVTCKVNVKYINNHCKYVDCQIRVTDNKQCLWKQDNAEISGVFVLSHVLLKREELSEGNLLVCRGEIMG